MIVVSAKHLIKSEVRQNLFFRVIRFLEHIVTIYFNVYSFKTTPILDIFETVHGFTLSLYTKIHENKLFATLVGLQWAHFLGIFKFHVDKQQKLFIQHVESILDSSVVFKSNLFED